MFAFGFDVWKYLKSKTNKQKIYHIDAVCLKVIILMGCREKKSDPPPSRLDLHEREPPALMSSSNRGGVAADAKISEHLSKARLCISKCEIPPVCLEADAFDDSDLVFSPSASIFCPVGSSRGGFPCPPPPLRRTASC